MDIERRKNLEQEIIKKAHQDNEFYSELVENPKEAIEKHYNLSLPPGIKINLVEEKEDDLYLVVPLNPEKLPQGELSDEHLEQMAGGICWVECECKGLDYT